MVFWYFQNKPAHFHFKRHFSLLLTQLETKSSQVKFDLTDYIKTGLFSWCFVAGLFFCLLHFTKTTPDTLVSERLEIILFF